MIPRLLLAAAVLALGAYVLHDASTVYHEWTTQKLEGAAGFVIVGFGLILAAVAWNGGK